MMDYEITRGGLVVPKEPAPEPERCDLILTGQRGIRLPEYDDGYCGHLRVRKNGIEVLLPVTTVQHEKLCQMGIGEWT